MDQQSAALAPARQARLGPQRGHIWRCSKPSLARRGPILDKAYDETITVVGWFRASGAGDELGVEMVRPRERRCTSIPGRKQLRQVSPSWHGYIHIAILDEYRFCCALFPHGSSFSISRNGFTTSTIDDHVCHHRLGDLKHFRSPGDSPPHHHGVNASRWRSLVPSSIALRH